MDTGRITPFSVDWMFRRANKKHELSFFVQKDLFVSPYVTNNVASNTLSVTMKTEDFLAMIEDDHLKRETKVIHHQKSRFPCT